MSDTKKQLQLGDYMKATMKVTNAEGSKWRNESPDQHPLRKIRTPELPVDLLPSHIHKLPELRASETERYRNQSDLRAMEVTVSNQQRSDDRCAQIRSQGRTYQIEMERKDENSLNTHEMSDILVKDNEMLHDRLDETESRLDILEKHMEERIKEMNKRVLNKEEELTKKECVITSLNKEMGKARSNLRVTSAVTSQQVQIQQLQQEIQKVKEMLLIQSNTKEKETRMLQEGLADMESNLTNTDKLVLGETKELQRRIAILAQSNEKLEEEREELMQMLKIAKDEARKQEAIARSYAARINQVRSPNLKRTESRMSIAAERRVLTIENADEPQGNKGAYEDDNELSSAGAQAQMQVPAAVHQLLKLVDWPRRKACFQHDEFCEKVEHTFTRGRSKGIPGYLLAESLHSAIQKQEKLARLYNSEIGTAPELTFDTVMGALRKCDRVFSEKSNYEKWESVVLEEEESIFSFCKRVERAYKDYKVGEEGNEDLQAKMVKERVIKGANLSDTVAASILTCENLQKLPGYIQQALDRETKTEDQAETPARRVQDQHQKTRQQQQQPQRQLGPVKQTYQQAEGRQQQPQQSQPQRQQIQQLLPQHQAQATQPQYGQPQQFLQQPQHQLFQQFQFPPPPQAPAPPQQYLQPQHQSQQQAMQRAQQPQLFQQLQFPPPPLQKQSEYRYQQNQQMAPQQAHTQYNAVLQQAGTTNTQTTAAVQVAATQSERAPTGFEKIRANSSIQMCTKCRRIQSGHRWTRCQHPPFCSYCQEEGHTDTEHRMQFLPPQHQRHIAPGLQQNEDMQGSQI